MSKKINHPLVKGNVKEVFPNIYCVTIDDDYDRAMLFCRYQEFYESPTKKYRGKYFSWIDYMRYYKDHWRKDTFTYPIDWSGYNIPSAVLEKGVDVFYKETEYDEIMNDIFFYCAIDSQNKNNGKRTDWYLIGASSKDFKTMDHEIAHGLYFTNKSYQIRMKTLLHLIPTKVRDKINNKLIKMGYVDDKKILDDEAQAFLSTGLYNGLETKEIKKYEKDFIKVFKEFKKSD
jgi:hypothetical protein